MMFLPASGIITVGLCLCLAAPAAPYRSPLSVAVSPDGKTLYVSDKTAGCVTRLDAATGDKLGETTVAGEPHGLALSADGKILYVAQRKTNSIALIDTKQGTNIGRIPVGSWPIALALAKNDGRLYCCNQGGHTVSVIDLTTGQQVAEIPVIRAPAFAAISADESRVVVANSLPSGAGTDPDVAAEVSILDTRALRQVSRVRLPPGSTMASGVWIHPNGKWAYYYAGAVGVLDAIRGNLLSVFPLGKQPAPDSARRGEIYFHDATRCFQHWHSCATCHLDGGRVDGLPWDFLRDGIDNGKDVISLVNLLHTPPYNRLATRPNARYCIESGVVVSHHVTPDPAEVDDLLAYVGALTAEVNPNLPKFAEAAQRGKALFEGRADCARCHPGPYFTDKRTHHIGVTSPNEPNARYDTPSLVEAYRTAPYYHDGRAATLRDALTQHDPEGLHGKLSKLSPSEIDDLIAYVLSL